MDFKLDIKENAIDSFNEALAKFEEGEKGNSRAYKFAILHMAHFIELVLKMYVIKYDENLVFVKCFDVVKKKAKADNTNYLTAYLKLVEEEFDFSEKLRDLKYRATIKVEDALIMAQCEVCQRTNVGFVDEEFVDDINWMKTLRNDIEHYHFSLSKKDVRLCIGRLVRGVYDFIDIFGLFDFEKDISKDKKHVFEVLADEYSQSVQEAKIEVREKTEEAFRGVRPKHYEFVNWHVYECSECQNNTMIPNEESETGYRCTFCGNEESDEIEVDCDSCGVPCANGEMEQWQMEDGSYEYRCYHCSGRAAADKDRD